MEKIVDYDIISVDWRSSIEEKVKKAIIDGWEPLGGICVIVRPYGNGNEYFQAMVKKEWVDKP